jgi:hypothetical protein
MRTLFKLLAMVLLVAGLVSCSLSQTPKTTAEPTLNPNEVATRVQNLLASSVPEQTKIPAQPTPKAPTATQSAPASPTKAPETAAPEPSATPTTAANSGTPTVAATATPPPTPTASGSDPRASLGNPTRTDKFDNNQYWFPFTDSHTKIVIENGVLSMTGISADGWHGWTLTTPKVTNFYLEVSAKTGTCDGHDSYGPMLRSPDATHGYLFAVSCNGQYRFVKVSGNDFTDLIKWTANSVIKSGSDQTNRLGVMAKGDKFTLYVNGVQVGEVSDSDNASGVFGLFVSSFNTPNFTVQVSEVDYWNQP